MASPTVTYSTVTTVLKISDYGDGKVEIDEVKSDETTIPDLHSGNRKQIDFPLPVPGMMVVGYYDEDDKEVGLYFTLAGTQIGSKYTAGVDSGVNLSLNLLLASGNVGVYKKGNELRAKYGVSAGVGIFSKSYNDDFKLFDI